MLKSKEVQELAKRCLAVSNPFLERNEYGKLVMYDSPKQAYIQMISYLMLHYQAGLIDIPLVFIDIQYVTLAEAKRRAKYQDFIFIDWSDLNEKMYGRLQKVLYLLLRPYGIEFNTEAFASALQSTYIQNILSRLKQKSNIIIS